MQNKEQTLKNQMQSSERSYAKRWEKSSDLIRKRKGYVWMADFVKGHDKILEIGCGNGNGTLELAKKGHKIVCIEENINCIKMASKKLQQYNINYKSIRRGTVIDKKGLYNIKYKDTLKGYEPSVQVYIIEGNIFSFQSNEDKSLYNWLLDVAPFDGIVCWLIGAHELEMFNSLIFKQPNFKGNFVSNRENIHSLVAQNKNALVREDGVIHFVDRLERGYSNAILNADYKTRFCQNVFLPVSKCNIETMYIGDLSIDGGVEMGKLEFGTNNQIKCQKSDAHLCSTFYKF